jgi:hypothetical protein
MAARSDAEVLRRLERALDALATIKARAQVYRYADLVDTSDAAEFSVWKLVSQLNRHGGSLEKLAPRR